MIIFRSPRFLPQKVGEDILRRNDIFGGAVVFGGHQLQGDILPKVGGALHVQRLGAHIDVAVVLHLHAHGAGAALLVPSAGDIHPIT